MFINLGYRHVTCCSIVWYGIQYYTKLLHTRNQHLRNHRVSPVASANGLAAAVSNIFVLLVVVKGTVEEMFAEGFSPETPENEQFFTQHRFSQLFNSFNATIGVV